MLRKLLFIEMHALDRFGVHQMMDVRAKLRKLFDDGATTSVEASASRVANLFRDSLVDRDGTPACPLVRVYKTHPFKDLDRDLQQFARRIDPSVDSIPDLRCLVLLATEGDRPEWKSRHLSVGHRAIPLTSARAVAQAPMVSQLIRQMGIEISDVIRPEPGLLLKTRDQVYDLFYVAKAPGSPYIPAQNFVENAKIESVIGFGGLLASGDLVATILFSKVPISEEVAGQFKVIGLNFKLAMMASSSLPLFG